MQGIREPLKRLRRAANRDGEPHSDEETVRSGGKTIHTDGVVVSGANDCSSERRSDREKVRTDGGTVTEERRETGQSLLQNEFVQSLPFWLPPFLLMGFFVYGAIGWNLVISFTDFASLTLPTYDPATFDLEMYRRAFSDPNFRTAARNTIALLVTFTTLCLVVGLALAILVDREIRFENTFRTIYLLPMSLSFVVTAKVWAWMYNFESGMINITLRQFGLDFLAHHWISDPTTKLAAVIFALIWQFSGYAMVVYLAGLRAIPDAHYEAARVDGASSWRMYRRVIIPQLRSSTIGAAVVLMVFALKAFDFLYVMFGNNPGPAADILATMMFREAFASNNWAYGSAIAIVLFLMALAVVGPYLYSEYRRGEL